MVGGDADGKGTSSRQSFVIGEEEGEETRRAEVDVGLLEGSEDQTQSHHRNYLRREDLLLPYIVVCHDSVVVAEEHQAVLLFLQG